MLAVAQFPYLVISDDDGLDLFRYREHFLSIHYNIVSTYYDSGKIAIAVLIKVGLSRAHFSERENRSFDQNCLNAPFFVNSARVLEVPTEFINKIRWGQRLLGLCPEA